MLECCPSCFLVLLLLLRWQVDQLQRQACALQAMMQLKAAVAALVTTAFVVPMAIVQYKQSQIIQTFMCFSGQKV